MRIPKDYSEYVPSESEKYHAYRRGGQYADFDYFNNEVRFSPQEKKLHITVDHYKEDVFYQEEIEEYEKAESERAAAEGLELRPEALTPEQEAEDEQMRLDGLKQNEADLADFRCRYNIRSTFYDDPLVSYQASSDEKEKPLHNVLSGAKIDLNYGEGILDFIYADFAPAFNDAYRFIQKIKLVATAGQEQPRTAPVEHQPQKVYNRNQELVDEYFRYQSTLIYTRDVAHCSLYTAICPPLFERDSVAEQALVRYGNHLNELQKEYAELIEFCFDQDFWPEVLGRLHPVERYHLCRELRGLAAFSKRSEVFTVDLRRMTGTQMPYGMRFDELNRRIGGELVITDRHRDFAAQYGLDADKLAAKLTVPRFLNVHYRFYTVAEMLDLEFTKLLEADVRFRKCQRCGRYFILKGNYDARYCDRVNAGETRPCRDLAAQENYNARNADNQAVAIYRRYYKRYAARVQARQIKEAEFKQWKYQALTRRDECQEGKLTPGQLTEWMEASFPNRRKKSD